MKKGNRYIGLSMEWFFVGYRWQEGFQDELAIMLGGYR